jgi:membrane protein YqaA with SNARE-associated domain
MVKVNQDGKIHWLRLSLILVGFLLASAAIGYFLQSLLARFQIPDDISAWLVYSIIFGITLVVNLSVIPLPFAVSLMIAASLRWNPILVALSGSLGASLGEFSSYLVGYFGTKTAIHKEFVGYKMVQGWIKRYGVWAIAFLSFQPILPIEIGGLVAGIAKMPVIQFLPALWIGKFPKYLILVYAAMGIIHLLPLRP